MSYRCLKYFSLAVVALVVAASVVDAQERQRQRGERGGQAGRGGFRGGQGFGGGGPGGFGGGGGLLGLLRIDEVQQEIELIDEQKADVDELLQSLRPERADGNFRDLSDEERQQRFAEIREQMQKQAREAETKLAEILLPHQTDRLKEIQLQVAGVQALQQDEVAAALKLNDEQKQKIAQVNEENRRSMREQMQAIFQGGGGQEGGREAIREKMEKLRKESDEKVLAVLTTEQKDQFAQMKGEPFEMPSFGFGGRGGRGGFGRGGEGGRGGDGGRPERPERPEA